MNLAHIKQYYFAVPKDTQIKDNLFLQKANGFIFADKETLKHFEQRNEKELSHHTLIDVSCEDVCQEMIILVPNKPVYERYLIPKLIRQSCENIYLYEIEELENSVNFRVKPFIHNAIISSQSTIQGFFSDIGMHALHTLQGELYDLERGKYWAQRFKKAGGNLRIAEGCRFKGFENIEVGDDVYIGHNVTIEIQKKESYIEIGSCTSIDAGTIMLLNSQEKSLLRIGQHCRIGYYSFINCGFGVSIGSYTRLGPRVNINNYNHVYEDKSKCIIHQGSYGKRTYIEEDCWIGTNATILGVILKKGAVVGAGSLVNKDVMSLSVVAGVPAKEIKKRGQNEKV